MSAIPGRYPLTIFFDGDCPICAREISILKWLNRRQRIQFVNFADSRYDEAVTGLARSELGRVIHGRWADGEIMLGIEVFRATWSALGLGLLSRFSRLPIIDVLLVRGYEWFARNRLSLTGRTNTCKIKKLGSKDSGEDSLCQVKG